MTPLAILSLCLLFVDGWNLAAPEHADQCISPIICNGEPSWIETSKVISTCHKPCNSCGEEVKKAKDSIDGMMRELKEDFESVRKIVERHSTDVSTQQDATSIGSQAPTPTTKPTEVTTMQATVICAGFLWNGKCFWADVSFTRWLNYAQAKATCEGQNSQITNIYNSNHYNQVTSYLRSKFTTGHLDTWLGMTYDPSTGNLTLYNGTETNYKGFWFQESKKKQWPRVVVRVDATNSKSQGMWNWTNGKIRGVLCEINK